MIIFYDATVVCQAVDNLLARTGVWRVVLGLWESLALLTRDSAMATKIIPFSLDSKYDVFYHDGPEFQRGKISPYSFPFHPISRRQSIANITKAILVNRHHSVVFAPYGPVRADLGLLESKDIQIVHYIHDLVPVRRPELCSQYSIDGMHRKLDEIRNTDVVLTNSTATLNHFNHWRQHSEFASPDAIVRVLEPGLSNSSDLGTGLVSSGVERLHHFTDKKFFLSISTLEPRKNMLRLLKAFRLFKQQSKTHEEVTLVMVGSHGWLSDSDRVEIDECLSNQSLGIIHLGYISDAEVDFLLKRTLALIQVSLDEGFSFPVHEARANGKICICSDIPALNDCLSQFDIYVNPLSIESIANGLASALTLGGRAPVRFQRDWDDVSHDLRDIVETAFLKKII